MGFEKFGKSAYVSQTKISRIISFLEKGEVPATRCKKCKRLYFPPRAECLDCKNSPVEWIPLDGRCQLITFTEVHFAPPAFQMEVPYLLGLAELNEGPRVFAPIENSNPKSLKPGVEMMLKVAKGSGEGVFYQLSLANPSPKGSNREKRGKDRG